MARRLSGVTALATRYMRSRQLQKSSVRPSRLSARPAKARWNAWLCASTRPGSTGPARCSASCGAGTPAAMCDQWPDASVSSTTDRCQPPSTHAAGAQ